MTVKRTKPVSRERCINAMRSLIDALGYEKIDVDPDMGSDPSGKSTAVRAADAYIELLSKGQEQFRFTKFPWEKPGAEQADMISVTRIEFASLCAHHLLPYVGYAHVAYVPDAWVCGLSKIARIVEHYAHRPSIQEDLSTKIATFMEQQLSPKGCMVVIEASHMCMAIRGVEKPGHLTITSSSRGCFQDQAYRYEFLSMINRERR